MGEDLMTHLKNINQNMNSFFRIYTGNIDHVITDLDGHDLETIELYFCTDMLSEIKENSDTTIIVLYKLWQYPFEGKDSEKIFEKIDLVRNIHTQMKSKITQYNPSFGRIKTDTVASIRIGEIIYKNRDELTDIITNVKESIEYALR